MGESVNARIRVPPVRSLLSARLINTTLALTPSRVIFRRVNWHASLAFVWLELRCEGGDVLKGKASVVNIQTTEARFHHI